MLERTRNNRLGANLNFSPEGPRLNFPHPRSAALAHENAERPRTLMNFQASSRGPNMPESPETTARIAASTPHRPDNPASSPYNRSPVAEVPRPQGQAITNVPGMDHNNRAISRPVRQAEMTEPMTTLLLSNRHTEDNQALWRSAIRRGWNVERAHGIRIPEIADDEIVLYVESLFAPTIAEALGLTLLEPAEDWLARLSPALTRRSIRQTTLGNARQITFPAFIKPPNDKSFTAKVFTNGAELPAAYDDAAPVLVSEPVKWEVEFRCFMLDGEVRTLSPCLRNGRLAREDEFAAKETELGAARSFAQEAAAHPTSRLPRAVVIDVGIITNQGWAVVEANAAWGSGIYGCDPDAVLDVIRHAIEKAN